jgi:hypothetical protein
MMNENESSPAAPRGDAADRGAPRARDQNDRLRSGELPGDPGVQCRPPVPTTSARRGPASPVERWTSDGLRTLATQESEGGGFKEREVARGRALALQVSSGGLTDAEWQAAAKMLRKYRPQIGAPPRSGRAPEADDEQRRLSQSQRLAELLVARAPMVESLTGRAYALIDGTAHACDSGDFRGWCAHVFWTEYRETIGDSAIRDVIRALTGGRLPTRPISVRVGGDMSRVLFDLGSSALAITAAGIGPDADAVFARPKGSEDLPVPVVPPSAQEAAEALEELRRIVGLQPRPWAACVAWMLAALRPEGPYPLLYLRGEAGAGKSRLASAILSIVDPRRPQTRALPRETRDLAIRAEHMHALGFDNISMIPLELSDALCRLATGDGFDTRALHSDRDLAVFEASRPMLMTSIVDAATRPDLLDRALLIDVPNRTERANDDEIRAAVERVRPRVLGALLAAVSHALRSPRAAVPGEVRMRAAASFAAQGAPALGLDAERIIQAYLDSRKVALSIAAEDPVVDALMVVLRSGKPWEGSATELLQALDATRRGPRPQGWPENPRGLSGQLRRLAATLREIGIRHVAPDAPSGHVRTRVHWLQLGKREEHARA